MAISSSTLAFEMHDRLYTLLHAEMVPGKRLAALISLHKSAQLDAVAGPGAGIALRGWEQPTVVAQRLMSVRVHFEIGIAARSLKTATKMANLDDAVQAIRPILDDGAGGGIIGILNDPRAFALPDAYGQPLASETQLGATLFEDGLEDGAERAIWARCTVAFSAVGYFTY